LPSNEDFRDFPDGKKESSQAMGEEFSDSGLFDK
jgi:hypothetical protein